MKLKLDALPISTVLLLMSMTDGSPLPRSHTYSKRYADVYDMYTGNGSPAEGWPLEDAWVPSFDTLFQLNTGTLLISCAQFNAPDNSQEEIQGIYNAILQVSGETGVDPRFIFAITMQESTGCVRAPTTNGGVMNPGLMQDHNGTASCNTAGVLTTPCPQDTITQMIRDGTAGTPYGYGLEQLLTQTGVSGVQEYYMAARLYNSGSIAAGGDLGAGGSTHCYASDIANRLTGWVHASHACCLNEGCYGGATTYASTPATGWWSSSTTAVIVPSWLATTDATGTATELSSYTVTIQPSVVSSIISVILTDSVSATTPEATGGIFAPTSESFSLAPTSSISVSSNPGGIFAPTSETFAATVSTSSVSVPSNPGGIFAPTSETFATTTSSSSASLVSGIAMPSTNVSFPTHSTNTSSATAATAVTSAPVTSVTASPVGSAATYTLTIGTQTVTYTVEPGNIYWATALTPYLYWAATSTPVAVSEATSLSEPTLSPTEATPTTTIPYEGASAAGLTPAASVQSLVARSAVPGALEGRTSYDTHFTTMLVDVPVVVPVPFETKTVNWTATVTETQTLKECEAEPTIQPSSAAWSGSWTSWDSATGASPTRTSSNAMSYPISGGSYAYPIWTSSWAATNTTSQWHPSWTATAYPTRPASWGSMGWGTSYGTGWSTGFPSSQPMHTVPSRSWTWASFTALSSGGTPGPRLHVLHVESQKAASSRPSTTPAI